MIVAAVLALMGQAISDPALLERKVGEREYTFCFSSTDPFPDDKPSYDPGIVVRRANVRLGRLRTIAAGSPVLVAGERDGYAAVFDPRTGDEGCVATSAIRIRRSAVVNDGRRWIGEWEKIGIRKVNKDSVSIRHGKGSKLRILGDATWKGLAEMPDDATNFGSIDSTAVIHSGAIELVESEGVRCRVSLRLTDGYLIVADRDAETCNGNNVTFSGVYRRVSR
jgi:hypothetical protein